MCMGCWEQRGKPSLDTPAVRAAAAAIDRVYEHHVAGGNLHIVVDDWNIEDVHLDFCAAQIARGGHPEDPDHVPWYTKDKLENPDPPEQLAAEQRCYELLRVLSLEERAAALAWHRGFVPLTARSPLSTPADPSA